MTEYIIGAQPAKNYLTYNTDTNQISLNTEDSVTVISSARWN
jgi:hypothetical protein